jgi:hypothetical protein
MWEIVNIVPDSEIAEKFKTLLENSSILVRINKSQNGTYQIFVPSTELEQAQEIILGV